VVQTIGVAGWSELHYDKAARNWCRQGSFRLKIEEIKRAIKQLIFAVTKFAMDNSGSAMQVLLVLKIALSLVETLFVLKLKNYQKQ